MDLELVGKVAIVTWGASGGLGENMAVRLLEEGCRVMVADRNAQRNAELVARLAPLGEVAGHVSDVSTEDFAEPLAAATVEAFGGIDVVVNNAATYPSHPWNEYTLEEWDRTINTNLRSLFLMSKATVPHIAARGGGSIVNIGSINAYVGLPNLGPYSVSKGGLMTMTKNAALALGPYRIRVNQLNVGWTLTEGEERVQRADGRGPNWLDEAVATRPFGRLLLPADIAHVAAYFASDDSLMVSGAVVDLEQFPIGALPTYATDKELATDKHG